MSKNKLPKALMGEAVENGAQKRVLTALDEKGALLAAALRRSVPVFMRKGIEISATPTKIGKARDLYDELKGPVFHVPLATDPGGSRAMLCFDGGAVAFLLEATLGGLLDESATIEAPSDLTGPQKAVLGRLAEGFVKVLSDVLSGLGVRLRRLPPTPVPDNEGELAAITFHLAERDDRKVTLAISRDALASAGSGLFQSSKKTNVEGRVAGVLSGVELDLVVELGRVRRKLSHIDALKVGDVIRLDAPARTPVLVRVQGQPILRARPTAAGTQLAVQVLERLGSWGSAPVPREQEGRGFEPAREVASQ